MPCVRVGNANIHYQRRGSGPAVALLHGFPLDSTMWRHQLDALATRWTVITPDLRGFGDSRPASPFTIEDLAEDVHGLLAQLGVLPCVVGGLSMGGYVSFAFAERYADELRGLVLVDTRAEADTPEARENRLKMIEKCRVAGPRAVADEMELRMLAPDAPAEVRAAVRRMMESCPADTIEYALMAMRQRRDYTGALASIRAPALVIVGERDAITPPAVAQSMHRAIPGSRLCVIEGAGHMAPMESPRAVTAAIDDFMAALYGAGQPRS